MGRAQRAHYFAFINATVVSSIRLLKPHSLWLPPPLRGLTSHLARGEPSPQ
jgi:hypothetical protein